MAQTTDKDKALKKAQARGWKVIWFDGKYWHAAKNRFNTPYYAIEAIDVD